MIERKKRTDKPKFLNFFFLICHSNGAMERACLSRSLHCLAVDYRFSSFDSFFFNFCVFVSLTNRNKNITSKIHSFGALHIFAM